MAVRDLLWTCPDCRDTILRPARRGDLCERCGTSFRRGRGDAIVATRADGTTDTRPATTWLDLLLPRPPHPPDAGPEPARLAEALPEDRPVHYDGELIGWVERFGRARRGVVRLTGTQLRFDADDGSRTIVEIDDLTSIQPSSRKLLLGRRNGPVLALQFPKSNVSLWESRLQAAVNRRWAASGRGEVCEYQPRIRAR